MQCEKHTKIIIMPYYNVNLLSKIISLSVKFWTSLVTGIRASAMEIGSIRLYQNNNCTLFTIKVRFLNITIDFELIFLSETNINILLRRIF